MMRTRCPACSTVFRVTPEQLKARHGKVRCGKCQHVFDALETLLDAPSVAEPVAAKEEEVWPKTVPMAFGEPSQQDAPEGAPETAAPQPAAANEEPGFAALDDTLDDTLIDTSSMASDAVVTASESATAAAPHSEPGAEPQAEPQVEPQAGSAAGPAPESATEPAAEAKSAPEPAQAIEPALHDDDEPVPRRRAWTWALACILALLVLLLQALVQFRVELAVLTPELKPTLQALCGMLECDLPLPRKADQLSIETSDLHPDPNNKGQLILAATLKNRAPFAQTHPHLELTLTDTLDQPLLRKIIAPVEYLPKGTNLATGFAANREIAVNLALIPENAAKATAAGYRLYLFYP